MERLKLRGRIVEKFGTIGAFCQTLGINPGTARNVLSGRTTPTRTKLLKWCEVLEIEPDDVGIFFYR